MTSSTAQAAVGELAAEVRGAQAAIVNLGLQIAPVAAWAAEDRAKLTARVDALEAEVARLLRSTEVAEVEALRGQVRELREEATRPPPRLVQLADQVGTTVATLVGGMTPQRFVGALLTLLFLGVLLKGLAVPAEDVTRIVLRVIDVADRWAPGPGAATPPEMPAEPAP